jgi:heat shock protein HslJ
MCATPSHAAAALALSAALAVPSVAGTAPRELGLPATFRGDLPCADCEAVRHHLDVWPDGVFHLRREWVGRDLVRDEIGRWQVDPGSDAIALHSGAERPLRFEIEDPDRLRLLDVHGRPIVSTLPYALASDGVLSPIEPMLLLGGEMRYVADAPRFTECLTGRSYPMAKEGDYPDAERAYLAERVEPGAALYLTVEGSIAPRPKADGTGLEPGVVVRRFVGAWPGERCERAMADAALTNTYWRITRLGDAPVSAFEGRREPHLVLRSDGGRHTYVATAGCNRLVGAYAVDGELIAIAIPPATRTACPPPLDALERALTDTLERAARWQIRGNTLELADRFGNPLALFAAVHF